MIQASDFTTAFPEFANATIYPLATINFWIPQAYNQLSATRFGDVLDLAAMLFVAHNMVLSAREARVVGANGVVGDASGPVASKSVGPLSKGFSTTTATTGAGIYNATSYGMRLLALMKQYTLGPVYVGRYRTYGRAYL